MNNLYIVLVTIAAYILTAIYPVVPIHLHTLKEYSYILRIMNPIYEIPLSFVAYFGLVAFLLFPFKIFFMYKDVANNQGAAIKEVIKKTIKLSKRILYISTIALLCIHSSETMFNSYYKNTFDSFNNPNMIKAVLIFSLATLFANIIHSFIKLIKIRINNKKAVNPNNY